MNSLLSSPEEKYVEHIERCQERLDWIYPIFKNTLIRIFDINDEGIIRYALVNMINFHDLGKLTQKWQKNVAKGKKLPSHAPVGAAYLYKRFTKEKIPEDLKNAICFAVSIHHTDRGLLGDNIERPDIQAIMEGVVDYDGKIIWAEGVRSLSNGYYDEIVEILTVYDLKETARSLRIWARGDSLLNQHKKRLQASLMHHILKLCDISAASERKEYHCEDKKDYFGGWLMVETIESYVNAIKERLKK